MKITADKVTAIVALMGLAWGAFIYINDIRALSRDMAVRNVGHAVKELCKDPADEMMWAYLNEEIARYNRYTDVNHRFTGAKTKADLGCRPNALLWQKDTPTGPVLATN